MTEQEQLKYIAKEALAIVHKAKSFKSNDDELITETTKYMEGFLNKYKAVCARDNKIHNFHAYFYQIAKGHIISWWHKNFKKIKNENIK